MLMFPIQFPIIHFHSSLLSSYCCHLCRAILYQKKKKKLFRRPFHQYQHRSTLRQLFTKNKKKTSSRFSLWANVAFHIFSDNKKINTLWFSIFVFTLAWPVFLLFKGTLNNCQIQSHDYNLWFIDVCWLFRLYLNCNNLQKCAFHLFLLFSCFLIVCIF